MTMTKRWKTCALRESDHHQKYIDNEKETEKSEKSFGTSTKISFNFFHRIIPQFEISHEIVNVKL